MAKCWIKTYLCLLLLTSVPALGSSSGTQSRTRSKKMVEYHELRRNDFSITSTNWGATVLSVVLPDSKGNLADVALGYDTTRTIAGYVNDTTNFGALVGRVANRIAGAQFVLDGKKYKLYPNDGNNTLHGGHRGFAQVLWTVKEKFGGDYPSITYYYRSFDGEQGFPGDLDVYVTYRIIGDYKFKVEMSATPLTKPTPVNLAQHTYWNLGGHASGSVLSHKLQLFASRITPTDKTLIPTGRLQPVRGTLYDFLEPRKVARGYDMNYVVDGEGKGGRLTKVAVVEEGKSGRVMRLYADQVGVQLYTGGSLGTTVGKGGAVYGRFGGLCLETQGFPNAVNQRNFPSQIVRPGQVYEHNMLFDFSFR